MTSRPSIASLLNSILLTVGLLMLINIHADIHYIKNNLKVNTQYFGLVTQVVESDTVSFMTEKYNDYNIAKEVTERYAKEDSQVGVKTINYKIVIDEGR